LATFGKWPPKATIGSPDRARKTTFSKPGPHAAFGLSQAMRIIHYLIVLHRLGCSMDFKSFHLLVAEPTAAKWFVFEIFLF
jgi:hypothetical protein